MGGRLDPPAPAGVHDQVPRDPDQPRDRRPARRVVLQPVVEGSGEGLGDEVVDQLGLPWSPG